jgi:ferredoxin
MAHTTVDPDLRYRNLQRRLDRMPQGAPDTPAFRAILRLLFTPEEAELAARMPTLCSRRALARAVGRSEADIDEAISRMARRGTVFDVEMRGERWVMLAPVVVGFYETAFMHVGADTATPELVRLFDEYFHDIGAAGQTSIFRANVQVMRALVREEALADDPGVEVLDFERTSAILSSAATIAVATCPCRHHAQLAGRGCGNELRTCLSFNGSARSLVDAGLAEQISTTEAVDIVAKAKAAGMAQTADNVQRDIGFICNCCRCCCGFMNAVRTTGVEGGVTSSWVAETDFANCRGCKKCFRRCPVEAISVIDNEGRGRRPFWSVVDPDKCIGCGVCTDVCRWEGRYLRPRRRRTFTPNSQLDKMVAMAIERGKLGDLLVDTLPGVGPRTLAHVLQALERTPPAAALRAIEPLRSVFLRGLLAVLDAAVDRPV